MLEDTGPVMWVSDWWHTGPVGPADSHVRAAEESYYIRQKVITYAGVPHTGCHEMWVCPAFWPHFMAPSVGRTSICYNFLSDVTAFLRCS